MGLMWTERLAPLGQRIVTLSRLLDMASHQMDRTNVEAQKSGQALLLDAAAQSEQLHAQLKELVEELARGESDEVGVDPLI